MTLSIWSAPPEEQFAADPEERFVPDEEERLQRILNRDAARVRYEFSRANLLHAKTPDARAFWERECALDRLLLTKQTILSVGR